MISAPICRNRSALTRFVPRFPGRNRGDCGGSLDENVIGLRRPADYQPQQGARFEVHVEKSRAHFGDAGRPFKARLVAMPDGRGLTWSACDVKPTPLEEAAALFRSGLTVRAVAAQLGIAPSSAGRLRQKAQEGGLLDCNEAEAAEEDDSGTLH
jgi:hypothetical protein